MIIRIMMMLPWVDDDVEKKLKGEKKEEVEK